MRRLRARLPRSSALAATLAATLATTLVLAGCTTAGRRPTAADAGGPLLAITMDDLPVHGPLPAGETRTSVAERILAAFRAAGVPEVYGFVNGAAAEREPGSDGALAAWSAAGYPLGNHTWSHPNLDQVSAAAFEAELARNEATLERFAPGRDWRWLRYPYLVEGSARARRDSVRAALARRGYRIAAVTMDYSDWQWNDAYARCRAGGSAPALEALELAYLANVREAAARARTVSRALYGRDVPYVLLTHVSPFNARMMPRVLAAYREAGFRFTTLAAAQADSIYREDMEPGRPAGPTSLEARARARGAPVPPRTDRTAMLAAACR